VGVVGVDREVLVVRGQLSVKAKATAKEEADPPAARKDDKIQMGWVNGSIVGTFKPEERQIWGSLHCATHDETVNRFGRDDNLFAGILRVQGFKMGGGGLASLDAHLRRESAAPKMGHPGSGVVGSGWVGRTRYLGRVWVPVMVTVVVGVEAVGWEPPIVRV